MALEIQESVLDHVVVKRTLDMLMAQPQFDSPVLKGRHFLGELARNIVLAEWESGEVLNIDRRSVLFAPDRNDVSGVAKRPGEEPLDLVLKSGRPHMQRAAMDRLQIGGHTMRVSPAFSFQAKEAGASPVVRAWADIPGLTPQEKMAIAQGSLRQGAEDLGWVNRRLNQLRERDVSKRGRNMNSHDDDVLDMEVLMRAVPDLGFLNDPSDGWVKYEQGRELEPVYGQVYFLSNGRVGLRPTGTTERSFAQIKVPAMDTEIFMEVAGFVPGYNPDVDVIVTSKEALVRPFGFEPSDPRFLALAQEVIRRQGIRGWKGLKELRALEASQSTQVEEPQSTSRGLWTTIRSMFGRS